MGAPEFSWCIRTWGPPLSTGEGLRENRRSEAKKAALARNTHGSATPPIRPGVPGLPAGSTGSSHRSPGWLTSALCQ